MMQNYNLSKPDLGCFRYDAELKKSVKTRFGYFKYDAELQQSVKTR